MSIAPAFESLDQQLKVIQKQCALVCRRQSSRGEIIHELRVNCRKGLAALDFYGPLFPKIDFEQLRSRLARVLRESSRGRDLDTMIDALKNTSPTVPTPLLLKLKKDRRKEFRSFRQWVRKLSLTRERRKLKAETLESPFNLSQLDHQESLSRQAKQRIRTIVEELRGDSSVDEWTPKKLHRFRIRIKRLRYSLEIASTADQLFEISIVSTLLAQIQQALGEINDTVVRIRYLRKYLGKLTDQESQLFLNVQIAVDENLLADRLAKWGQFWTTDVQNKLYGDLMTRTF